MENDRKDRNPGNTFSELKLDPPLDPANPGKSVETLRAAVQKYKESRFDWYQGQMRSRSDVVNSFPKYAAWLGGGGVVLTSTAAVFRILGEVGSGIGDGYWDLRLMAVAVLAYTLMSAALLYERLIEGSGGYFRAMAAVIAIRDLWTAYQFADIGRSLAPPDSDAVKEIERWRAPAETFCKELDLIVANELTSWKTAYQNVANFRYETAQNGMANVLKEIKASAEAAADAATKAEDTAKTAASAHAPAILDLSLGTAMPEGSVVIKIDGKEVVRGTNQNTFSITSLKQGEHHVRVEFMRSGSDKMKPFEKSFLLVGGINDKVITVTE
jgi:hypothetical protein